MATTNSITTTYNGEFAGQYISAALLSGSTLDNGLITVKPNIKFKEVIKKVASDDIVKSASCDFDPTSTLTLTERIIQPVQQQVNLQLCKSDFESDWDAIQMGYSSFDTLPSSFADFLIGHVASKVAQRTEQSIWNGAAATAGQFGGFAELMLADADVTDVAAVGGGVNATNVIAQMGAVVDAINSNLYSSEDMTIYVSQNVARAYVRALGGFSVAATSNAGTDTKGTQWFSGQSLTFDGIKIAVANGLADNRMVAAEKTNLYFGTGLLSDQNEVKVLDMADIDGSKNVRVVMRFSAGVQYGVGSDIVLYS
jgi:hypothetical protein|tara:strand:- start:1305 stop:2237 length:933 start_codon:yes stop_codon:yes gene_type:complete